MISDVICIPSPELLNSQRSIVSEFKTLARQLGHFSLGWSYFIEWAWAFSQFESTLLLDKMIMDAGAGLGLSQWYLANHGATVYSVDRLSRRCLPLYFRSRYNVSGLRPNDLLSPAAFLNPFNPSVGLQEKSRNLVRSVKGILLNPSKGKASGKVLIYNHDLADLADIQNNSMDFIVSISSLEHNTPSNLDIVVNEMLRVLKPGGALIATLAAAKEGDWYHQPSSSWCYSEETLKRSFKIDAGVSSNYSSFADLMSSVRSCEELKRNLSFHYFLSGKNGMPWGRWNPLYLPVGVVKVKNSLE